MKAMTRVSDKGGGKTVVRTLMASCFAVTLAGCYQTEVAVKEYPTDYRQRHPIVVREGAHNVDILLGRNRGGLTPSQRADVVSFAQTWRKEAGSGINIEVPKGGPTDHAASDATSEVRSIFAAVGVPPNAIYVRSYHPPKASLASIRLNYTRLIADAGPCGEWPRDLGPTWDSGNAENQPFWNLGCASQRNLAAMVENPADLVQPRGETPAFAPRRSVVLDKYTKGTNPSGAYTGYEQGKISDLGK
jgi:pilus assembly protein CpaD